MVLESRAKIVLKLEYEGTNYYGFQWQENFPTVQGEIEKALWRLTGKETRVIAASRTDTGVHALGQMVSFMTASSLQLQSYVNGLNYYLPDDIAVKAAFKVNTSFNVRHDALSREYSYCISNRLTRSPIRRRFCHLVCGQLDIESMRKACQALIGQHDFASFTCSDAGVKSTVRNIEKAEIEEKKGMVIIKVVAGSFLHHQVRNIVGLLTRVGLGKMTVDEFYGIVKASSPGLARPRAPACGLCLTKINYPFPFWEEKWGDT